MTLGEIAQLITSVATLIGVLRVTRKVEDVHRATNGLVTKLVDTTRDGAFAAGQKDQKEHE